MGSSALKLNSEGQAAPALALVAPAPAATTRRDFLLSASADGWLLGGASLALLFFCQLVLRPEAPAAQTTWFVFNLSFLANFPHFLSSYQMLYGDFGAKLLKRPRFFWAGVVVPAALLGITGAAVASRSAPLFAGLSHAMFFFVGWHYAKQTFGVMVVSNAYRSFFYGRLERYALQANLLSVWMISWLRFAAPSASYNFQGFAYSGFGLPAWAMGLAGLSALLSGALVVALHLRRYLQDGARPATGAVIGWLAFQAWHWPAFTHPAFQITIPFFHSLQYLVFVGVFRHHKARAAAGSHEAPAGRARYLKGLYGQLAVATLLGALFMWYLPRALDQYLMAGFMDGQPTLLFNCFTIFINIHHYFIDNVLWRSDNDEIRTHLFGR